MVSLKIQLPQDFLNIETRCGFTVSHEMKEVWAVQLDLLAEFDRVCKKHNICYVASGGTLLGAVRHQGFIPWDDDVDLMLSREDYNRLCIVAQEEFEEPYFFQTEYSDPGFMRGFARLRNSQTSGVQKFEYNKNYRFNQGIFIDIFPLDEVTSDASLFRLQERNAQNYFRKACVLSEMTDRFPPNRRPLWKYIYKVIGHFLIGSIIKKFGLQDYYLKKYELTCSKYNGTKQQTWSLLSFQFNNRRHDLSVFRPDETSLVRFEFLKIPIPNNYDEHLKQKYGDYMQPKRMSNYHGDVLFDVNRSYKDVLHLL
ncbi:MAG: LicD family protein [Paludibacteraceae bacterium]|nr:LicD family protein [Paludibacteraceae bacterium]